MKFVYRKCHKALGALIGLLLLSPYVAVAAQPISTNNVAIFAGG